jgi:hypothetical protein
MWKKVLEWCKKGQHVVLMWCICGKPETPRPEKRKVLMVHLWWCCGAGGV